MINCYIIRGIAPLHKGQVRLEVQSDHLGLRSLCITSFPGTRSEYVLFADIASIIITPSNPTAREEFVVVIRQKKLTTDIVLVGSLHSIVMNEWYTQQEDSNNWIIFDYSSSSVQGALDPKTAVGKHVIWKLEALSSGWQRPRATLPPFPHSKHDMLGLAQNESVMRRLTRGGDTRIELTTDGVSISGVLSGTSQPSESESDCIDTFRSTCTFDSVIIVGDKTIYATSQNGSVLGKIAFSDFTPSLVKDSRGSLLVFTDNIRNVCACLSSNLIPVILDIVSRNTALNGNSIPRGRGVSRSFRAPSAPSVSNTAQSESGISFEHAVKSEKYLPKLLEVQPNETAAVLTLVSRVEELENQVTERDALLRLLQERLMASTIDSARNAQKHTRPPLPSKKTLAKPEEAKAHALGAISTRQNELEFLQQHLDCLRQYCHSLEQRGFDRQNRPEPIDWEMMSDQEALRSALVESFRREQSSKRRISNLEKDLQALKKATDEALRIMATRVEKAVEDVFEKKILAEPIVSLEKIKCMLKGIEDRAEEQTKANTQSLRQQNQFLVKELRIRDKLIDDLLADESSTVGGVTSTITRLHQERTDLEIKICSLQRLVEDIEETTEVVESALSGALSSQRSPLQAELVGILEGKISALSQLEHVQEFIARTSLLQRSLEKYEFSEIGGKWAIGTVSVLDK